MIAGCWKIFADREELFLAPDGDVGAGSEQLRAQQSLALMFTDLSGFMSAALQQLAILGSRLRVGTPATALPPRIITRATDVSHFTIGLKSYKRRTSTLSSGDTAISIPLL
jgi:hypothetical protein